MDKKQILKMYFCIDLRKCMWSRIRMLELKFLFNHSQALCPWASSSTSVGLSSLLYSDLLHRVKWKNTSEVRSAHCTKHLTSVCCYYHYKDQKRHMPSGKMLSQTRVILVWGPEQRFWGQPLHLVCKCLTQTVFITNVSCIPKLAISCY